MDLIYGEYLAGRGALRTAQAFKASPELSRASASGQFGRTARRSVVDRLRWIVTNPVYAGYASLGDDRYPGRHEAIIEPALWQDESCSS